MVAEVPRLRFPQGGERCDSIPEDSVPEDTIPVRKAPAAVLPKDTANADSLKLDTASMDSLRKAIWLHNKQIDDSLRADSLNRQRKNGIDAPVEYTAEDSMVYMGDTKLAFLYGKSHVKYENMDLSSDQIYMSMDSSLVHATGSRDTTKNCW